MSFCTACGAPARSRSCGACGGVAGVPAGGPPLSATPSITAGLTENSVGALCYLGGMVTGIVFLIIAPYNENPRIQFHAFQSILFQLSWILGWIAMVPVQMLLPFELSVLLSLFSLALWGGGLALWLFLMGKAYQGQTISLPVIGTIARQQAGKQ